MGLAASQARFLGLTARKSNIEYNVQQINQARTALSNEVMGLYEKYNDLEVPTPPVVNDYMTTKYTIDSTYEEYELGPFTKIIEGQYEGYYDLTLNWEEEIAKAYAYTAKDSVITGKKGSDGYSYLNFQMGLDSYTYEEGNEDGSTISKIVINDIADASKYQGLTTIMNDQKLTSGTFYMFLKGTTAYYTKESELDAAFSNSENPDQYYGDYTFDYQGSQKIPKSTPAIAALTQESNGRLSTIQIIEADELPDLEGKAYSISTSQEEDELSYDEAMNDYEYKKMLYEKEVDNINAKTKKLQEQDRTLELQINQLDTEQNAISTEMDSVKKVIEDTMEAVFKTFNG